jgi:hypothetical protein
MESVDFMHQQAEAMSEEQAKLIDERLATKDDIAKLREELHADIEALRLATKAVSDALRLNLDSLRVTTKTDLDAGPAKTKAEIIKWVVGMSAA